MVTKFYADVSQSIAELGGFHNAHIHLDRANTLEDGYVDNGKISVLQNSHISLQKKHALIATVHESIAYSNDDLLRRAKASIDTMVQSNTSTADTMVDVTADCVGTSALELLRDHAASRTDINLRVAAYTPLGFKDSKPEQWNIFERGVALADFIGSLPEADDRNDYPDNIGFDEHCMRMLALVQKTQKMLHVHTDQLNIEAENGTERLIDCMRKMNVSPQDANGDPLVWVVHMISPSTYNQKRYEKLIDGLLECNIGVISCPSAAIGMRQLRSLVSPTYNSIPRILDMASRGVRIRIGSDNIADMCSPSTTANLMDEIFVLSAAERYYNPGILAKFGSGLPLVSEEMEQLREHLVRSELEEQRIVKRWQPK
jgi:cytosine deaminase